MKKIGGMKTACKKMRKEPVVFLDLSCYSVSVYFST